MGTWGSGNLDSDGALDWVSERSTALIGELWGRVQKSDSWEADEWDHDALFVEFEILFALEAAGVFNGWELPPAAEVDRVRDTWLAGWDAYYPSLGATPEFTAERRGVIEATFARFRDICAVYELRRR